VKPSNPYPTRGTIPSQSDGEDGKMCTCTIFISCRKPNSFYSPILKSPLESKLIYWKTQIATVIFLLLNVIRLKIILF